MKALPARWRLLPSVGAVWLAAGLGIGTPDAALPAAGVVAQFFNLFAALLADAVD